MTERRTGSSKRRIKLPIPTFATLAILAGIVWLNAIVNHHRFNVVLGLLASVPVLLVVLVATVTARRSRT